MKEFCGVNLGRFKLSLLSLLRNEQSSTSPFQFLTLSKLDSEILLGTIPDKQCPFWIIPLEITSCLASGKWFGLGGLGGGIMAKISPSLSPL